MEKTKNIGNIILAVAAIAVGFGVNQRFTTNIDPPTQITVHHHHYTTYYNPALHEADSVSWDLTPEMVNCTEKPKLKDYFAEDPEIPDTYKIKNNYLNTQYDKGQLFSYDDASCDSIDRVECFYMSNMLPQPNYLNAGKWKMLEDQCRKWAMTTELHIIAGGINKYTTIGTGKVVVPQFCYKAVLMNRHYQCWVFPNDKMLQPNIDLDSYKVSTTELNKRTGLKLEVKK